MIGSSLAGLSISKFMVGSGATSSPAGLTSLINPWGSVAIASSGVNSVNRSVKASGYLSNGGLSSPKSMSEIGVFAIKNGQEFLLAYTSNTAYKEVIPSRTTVAGFMKHIQIELQLDGGIEGYASFVASTGLVTYDMMMEQINALKNLKLDKAGGVIEGNLTVKGTFSAKSTANPLYCDYAELFEFHDDGQKYTPGFILGINHQAPGEEYTYITSSSTPVGIVSRPGSYGHLLGGPQRNEIEDFDYSEYAPVGLSGRVELWIEGTINKGDKVTVSDNYRGYGVASNDSRDDIVGVSLTTVKRSEVSRSKFNKIRVLIK